MEAWVAWATVGNTLVAVASAVVAVIALKVSKRSTDAAVRSALADERQAALAEEEAQRYDPPWVVQQVSQARYLLLNDGREDVHGVRIEGDSLIVNPVAPRWDRIGQGETVEFYSARSLDQMDSTITVHWAREPGGGEYQWRCALP